MINKKNDKKTILLVEDEVIIAMSEQADLQIAGYEVLHVTNGEKAVEIINKADDAIDLILMDIDLGKGMDGTETAREILKTHDMPIVFLSSHIENEIVRKAEKITSYGYVVKNSGITVLNASIKMAFKLHDANKKSEEQKVRLETILNSIGDSVIATDISDNIIKMNPAAEKMTGWKFEDSYHKKINEVVNMIDPRTGIKSDNPGELIMNSLKEKGTSGHLILKSKDGKEYRISCSGELIKETDGRVSGAVYVFVDETQEYKYRTEIEKSQKLYHSLFENMLNGFIYCKIIFDDENASDFVFLSVNKAFEKLTNLTGVEGKRLSEFFPGIKNTDQLFLSKIGHVSNTGEPERFEYFSESMNMWFSLSVYSPENEYVILLFDVITDIKKSQENLKNSEKFLSSIIDQSPFPTWISDEHGTLIKINSACCELLKIKEDEVIGIYNILNDNIVSSQGHLEKVKNVYEKGETAYFEIAYDSSKLEHFKLHDSVNVILDVVIFPVRNTYGKITNAVIQHNNITVRKFIENKIHENDKLLNTIMDILPDLIFLYDINEGKINYLNGKLLDLTGYSKEEVLFGDMESILNLIHPDDKINTIEYLKLIKNLSDIQNEPIELRIKNKAGGYLWHNLQVSVYKKDKEGKPEIIFGIIRNIYKYKIIEEQLARKEYLFKLTLKNVPISVAAQDKDLKFLWGYNQRTANTEKIIGLTDRDIFLPEEAERLSVLKKEVMKTGKEIREEIWLNRSGKKMFLNIYIEPMRNDKGEITGIGIAAVDLTQIKEIEDELRSSEKKFRNLHESMIDAFIKIDMNGKIVEYNSTFKSLLGYSGDELSNLYYKSITPENWYTKEIEIAGKQILKIGHSDVYEKEFIKKDGTVFPAELRAFLLKDDLGENQGVWAIVRDISGRKQSEKQIKNLLHEKEMIIKEVNHRIKNNMNIIYGLLTIQANAQKNTEIKSILHDAASRTKTLSVLYRKLYCSDNVNELSVKEYITALVEEIMSVYPHNFELKTEYDVEDFLMNAKILSTLGIIINEFITNTMKYAFSTQNSGKIIIKIKKVKNEIALSYSDNGDGIPDTISFDTPPGFGLQLIKMLVGQLGGSIDFNRKNRNGYVLKFTI